MGAGRCRASRSCGPSLARKCCPPRLELGEDRTIVADLEALVSEHPLRERPWHELAVALHRSGRSPDALRRIATFRNILRDELGLDPPTSMRDLEARILDSDPALLVTPGAVDRP